MEPGFSYRFGPFLLDPRRRLLWRDQQRVPLYGKALETLLLLVQNADRVVEKEEMLREVWTNRVVEENNLTQSVWAARKALGDTTPHTYIITVQGCGYRFAAPVTVLRGPEELTAEGPDEEPLERAALRRLPSWRKLASMAVVLVIVALLLGLSWSRFGPTILAHSRQKRVPAVPVRMRRSVAIVGFQNLSGHEEDAWLSTALAEMLHTELAAGGQIRVLSQEEVERAKAERLLANTGGAPSVTGKGGFGSDLLVSGSYSIIGDKGGKHVRFHLRLESANSGESVAEIAESGSQTELFGLVSQAGEVLRQKLNMSELSPTQTLVVQASLPKDAEAARLYAEGLAKLRMSDAIGATERLQKAVALDPDYSLAHSALAEAWSVLGYDGKSRDEAEKAFQHSGSLLRQDQLSVEGQYRMASRDWSKAVEVYKALFGLFPDDVDCGLHLASAQSKASEVDDALATLEALRRLPAPAGNDPRIDLAEYGAWRALNDFKRMEEAAARAAETAKQQGKLFLLARARIRQCQLQMQRNQVEQEQALKSCREAQKVFVATGDRRGEAEALRVLGDAVSGADTGAAIEYHQRALRLDQEIGDLADQAAVVTQLATEYSRQGDHFAAKHSYEQAEVMLQQLGEKEDANGVMINIALELMYLGQVGQAEKMYRDAQESASATGNKYIEAMAKSNLGALQQQEGDLQGAQESYTQALEWLHQVGSSEFDGPLTRNLGELALAKGDLAGARALYEKAMAVKQASPQRLSAAETEIDMDELAMEEGQPCSRFEKSLAQMVGKFRHGNELSGDNTLDDQALAVALLARCQESEKQTADALQTIEQAVKISAKAGPSTRLSVVVAAARIRFASGSDRDQSRTVGELTEAIAAARKSRCFGVELEGRLTLGEVEIHSGAVNRGRTRLRSVEKDASRRGFALLARKAKAAA